ncbi:HIT family protein [Spirochaeta isovalerica]|uniref:ATP adenylyltransferase n=1 Tax=Spirochaeta isovalerica TaxID=150 RepID=A0A841R5G8_9SPIO|nr:HIT domain-containing protein [Spirochaeta isovalerica]MBB6479105.1 ATP adenylyltransferase [Spirochaeta isovalerica]
MKYFREKKPDGCILCLIYEGSKEVEDLTVYRSGLVSVTVNLYPYNPGHLLVFPNRHIQDVREMSEQEEREMSRVTKLTLDVLDDLFSPTAYNIGFNMGLEAGGSIDHLHQHIIPRYPREIGIAELIGGKKILVESPYDTAVKLTEAFNSFPSQDSVSKGC